MREIGDTLIVILNIVIILLVLAIALGAPVMWIWNALMPALFGLSKITFGQAILLNIFCSILFGKINIGSD